MRHSSRGAIFPSTPICTPSSCPPSPLVLLHQPSPPLKNSRSKRPLNTQLPNRNPTQQRLRQPIRRARHILRNLVPSTLHKSPRQSTLRVHRAQRPARAISHNRRVVRLHQRCEPKLGRHQQREGGRGLKALVTGPGHVLDGEEGAIGEEAEVQRAVGDDDVFGLLDDGRERGVARPRGTVAAVGGGGAAVEDGLGAAADGPVCMAGGVDRVLHGGEVEVVPRTDPVGEAEHVAGPGAGVCHVPVVEAGVYLVDCADGVFPEIGAGCGESGWNWREDAGCWEGEAVGEQGGVVAGFVGFDQFGEGGCVQIQEVLPGEDCGNDWGCFDRD